jgi:nitroimidazol reductase NimA-like FMN-containing flavoprotein (pyridoxamine 5'-phosphate oxidase superfamily)
MPGYGVTASRKGLLPWRWARERLERAHNYYVATARRDGRPHVMPVWGLWFDGAFYFSTGAQSRKARNLAANAECVVCTERADEPVIVEGVAEPAKDRKALAAFRKLYKEKYDWDMEAEEGIYVVRPRVAFGFIEQADLFPGSATRWRFE